jgi:leucyl-tRNA synthetase
LGNAPGSLSYASFPKFNPEFLVESEFFYPISINGKVKMNHSLSLDLPNEELEKIIRDLPEFQKYLNGQSPKKIIVVKGRIINVVV